MSELSTMKSLATWIKESGVLAIVCVAIAIILFVIFFVRAAFKILINPLIVVAILALLCNLYREH